MPKLNPCPACGIMPIKETIVHEGDFRKGEYPITIGRFVCPNCGLSPSWGQSYSVHCGWDKNIDVWNRKERTGMEKNDERPCIYKHTCGFEICTLSECPEYVAKTCKNKWFEESEVNND